MELNNEPNVKQEQKLLKIIIVTGCIAAILGAVFFFAGNFLPSTRTLADGNCGNGIYVYTVSGNCNSSTNQNIFDECDDGDTIKITSLFKVNANCDDLKNKDVRILIKGGTMRWDGKYKFYIGSNAKLFCTSGGELTCNATTYGGDACLYFYNTKRCSYNGSGANYTFAQVNAAGGVQSSGLAPLPVTLTRFETSLDKGKVNIVWTTATEINNDRFELERSSDNKTWKVIGTIKGNGNSTTLKNYSYTDNPGIITGALYYRLHQIDFNGENEYGPVSVVDNTAREKAGKVYPNPANDVIKVSLNVGSYQLTILDQSGKVVVSKQVDSDFETIDCKELPNGYYFVKLENESISESHRILVKH